MKEWLENTHLKTAHNNTPSYHLKTIYRKVPPFYPAFELYGKL